MTLTQIAEHEKHFMKLGMYDRTELFKTKTRLIHNFLNVDSLSFHLQIIKVLPSPWLTVLFHYAFVDINKVFIHCSEPTHGLLSIYS